MKCNVVVVVAFVVVLIIIVVIVVQKIMSMLLKKSEIAFWSVWFRCDGGVKTTDIIDTNYIIGMRHNDNIQQTMRSMREFSLRAQSCDVNPITFNILSSI